MSLFTNDYEVVKIDTEEMKHGAEAAKRLRGHREGGLPWMAILDCRGNELISSDGPDGNIGCPIEPAGIAHFMNMLEQTAKHADAAGLAAIRTALEEFAKPHQEKLGL